MYADSGSYVMYPKPLNFHYRKVVYSRCLLWSYYMYLWSVECLSIKLYLHVRSETSLSTVDSTGEIFEALTLVKLYISAAHYSSFSSNNPSVSTVIFQNVCEISIFAMTCQNSCRGRSQAPNHNRILLAFSWRLQASAHTLASASARSLSAPFGVTLPLPPRCEPFPLQEVSFTSGMT